MAKMCAITIRRLRSSDRGRWLELRHRLWPHASRARLREEVAYLLARRDFVAFVAVEPAGELVGFIEATLHADAPGCRTHPVAYLEGWYVEPDYRRQGTGRELVRRAERWAVERGCREIASDALVENSVSRTAHRALGYSEVELLAHFRRTLPRRRRFRGAIAGPGRSR
jgi:aminoglycoside 6'-N-acetyltransferase I